MVLMGSVFNIRGKCATSRMTQKEPSDKGSIWYADTHEGEGYKPRMKNHKDKEKVRKLTTKLWWARGGKMRGTKSSFRKKDDILFA